MTNILVVDDHTAIREPLAAMLRTVSPSFEVREAGSVAGSSAALERLDIAIVDLALPDGSGVEIIERVKRLSPMSRTLVLTSNTQTVETARAIAAGRMPCCIRVRPLLWCLRRSISC